MAQPRQPHRTPLRVTQTAGLVIALAAPLSPATVQAQSPPELPASTWRQCTALRDSEAARLRCFDQWAQQQGHTDSAPARALTPDMPLAAPPRLAAPARATCRDPQYSDLSRFWELEAGSDCGSLRIRAYRPISLSWIHADSVNTQPTSPSPDHTAATAIPYNTHETRIQLSVRTKIAQGLLTHGQPRLRDSLWFGYTQQSYWQLFSSDISRPFRATDHEPEITYIYPTEADLPGGWRLRYSGIRLVHQSNGQSLPLSRSWNRTVLLAGLEKDHRFTLQGQLWNRILESAADDDNPDISDLVGRAEVAAFWNVNQDNTLGITVRHSMQAVGNGSIRLEWLKKIGDPQADGARSDLRFHTQLFSGYGDTIMDYNRQRTVLSLGLSLVNW